MNPLLEAALLVFGYIVLLVLMVVLLVRTVVWAVESPRPAALVSVIALAGGWLVVVLAVGYFVFGVFPAGTLRF